MWSGGSSDGNSGVIGIDGRRGEEGRMLWAVAAAAATEQASVKVDRSMSFDAVCVL